VNANIPTIPFININIKAILDYYNNANNKEYLFLKLYYRVLYNNKVNKAKVIAKRSNFQVFTISQIVLLAILAKNRFTSKAPCLLYYIIKVAKGVYTLLS
jgi:hypothetical protein